MKHWARQVGWLATAILFIGCAPPEETESFGYAEVSYRGSPPLCSRTREALLLDLSRLATTFEFPNPDDIPVLLGPDAIGECDRYYDSPSNGCTFVLDGVPTVATLLASLPHELVHALRHQRPSSLLTPFWEEGIAEIYSVGKILPAYLVNLAERPDIRELARNESPGDFPYQVAAHFIAWLVDERGEPSVLDFINDDRGLGVDARFEEHFGMTLDAAIETWIAEAPVAEQVGDLCNGIARAEWSAGEIDLAADLGCEADGFGPWMESADSVPTTSWYFCLEGVEPGAATVDLVAGSSTARLRLVAWDCDDQPATPEALADKSIDAADPPTEIMFARCRWFGLVQEELELAGPVRVLISH